MNGNEFRQRYKNIDSSSAIIGRQAFTSAGIIVPLIEWHGELHLLFEIRSKNISQGGEICFPGGIFDKDTDESTHDTALRELYEETGVDSGSVTVLGMLGSVIALRGILVDCYVAVVSVDSMDALTLDTKEVHSVFSVPVGWFMTTVPEVFAVATEMKSVNSMPDGTEHELFPAQKLGLPEKYWHSWGGHEHRVLVYKTDNGPVWGLTAEVVYELVTKLQASGK